jgi:hypothetical protein
MVLSYDAYTEAVQDSESQKSRLEKMEADLKIIKEKMK